MGNWATFSKKSRRWYRNRHATRTIHPNYPYSVCDGVVPRVDKTRLPHRIAQAEEALVVRARELFHIAGDNIEEEQALDDTMYALHALRNTSQTSHCIPHRSEAA